IVGLAIAALLLTTVKTSAEQDLADANDDFTRLQAEVQRYSDVPRVKALLANSQAARIYAGATEIDMAHFFESFYDQLPSDAVFESIVYQRTSLGSNASPGTSAFSQPDLGE